ncbi:MAG: hypothetical protein R6V77_07025, partial [Candidatus Cloacimonadaceae bacterium]
MQFGQDARYFTARQAHSGNAPEIRIDTLISIQNCCETGNPSIVQQPPCLSNKPYTLLRAAGSALSGFSTSFATKKNQTFEIKRGSTNRPTGHEFLQSLTYSKPEPCQGADFLFATAFNRQKQTVLPLSLVFRIVTPGQEFKIVPDRE